ncbi:hypothetical protein BGZ49_008722 [Haplosporangium sp. Z 27]|nr:hypothetical protein BGZ49_008722 [Haplosporangium sp. Z 27]
MKSISQYKKEEILDLLQQGLASREIASRTGTSRATVNRIRTKENQDLIKKDDEKIPKLKGGRPRKMGLETAEHLKTSFEHGVIKTVTDACKEANKLLPTPVSASTVRRRLVDVGMKAKKADNEMHSF